MTGMLLFAAALVLTVPASAKSPTLSETEKLAITGKQLLVARAQLAKAQAEQTHRAASEVEKKAQAELKALLDALSAKGCKVIETEAGLACEKAEEKKK